jgi:hypothetical protein
MTVTYSYQDGSADRGSGKWNDVNSAVAYKRNCLTVDLICLGFVTAESAVVIHEEMEGWEDLIDALPTYLPGTPDHAKWWAKVAFPAFVTNETTLFTAKSHRTSPKTTSPTGSL